MISNKPFEHSNGLVDQAAATADHAIRSTQRATNDALDALSGSVQDMRHQAGPIVNRSSEQIAALAQRGVDAVRDSSQLLRDKAQRASDSTVGYIRDEPIKSVLIAAAAGATLLALLGLMTRSRNRA
jgi:ElaB/YqjD/DUF883 family membrane-anchored ribosome-binding protein